MDEQLDETANYEDRQKFSDAEIEQLRDMDNNDPGYERKIDQYIDQKLPPPPPIIMNADGTGSRLIITKIEVENFKSYQGKQTIGPFHSNFSSIVGPNGSGKSNVIDALLFVFTYKAKKIRADKQTALIHKSDKFPNCQSGAVSVFFCNIIHKNESKDPDAKLFYGDYVVVRDSEFDVRRTVTKMNNQSNYYLNSKLVNKQAVYNKLRTHGIDLDHNRFLILQGEVESIAMKGPGGSANDGKEGMLEYIEDIVGSSRFEPPLKDLNDKVEAINKQKQDKLDDVKRAEERRKAAEGPAHEALLFFQTRNQVSRIENKIQQLKRLEINTEISRLKTIVDNKKATYDECDQQLHQIVSENKRLQDIKKEMECAVSKCNKSLESNQKQGNIIQELDADARKEIKLHKENISKLEAENTALEKKIEKAKNVPAAVDTNLPQLEQRLVMLTEEIQELMPQLEAGRTKVEEKTAPIQAEKQILDKNVDAKSKIADQIGAKRTEKQRELIVLREDEDKCRKQVEEAEAKIETLKETVTRKTEQIKEINNILERYTNEVDVINKKVPEMSKKCEDLRLRVNDKDNEIAIARQKALTIKSGNAILNCLLQEQREGRLSGIHGRLGDLGAIDPKYDIAISSSTPDLDYIVVDSTKVAQACIRVLQKKMIGSTRFIAIDKVTENCKRAIAQPFEAPARSHRFFDLIKPSDPIFRPAFYQAVHDTLVVEELSYAKDLGLNGRTRRRVVTLHGDIVDPSGAMTGGGKDIKRGKMGAHSKGTVEKVPTEEEMAFMQRDTDALNAELITVRQQRQDLMDKLKMREGEIEKMRFQIIADNNQLTEAEKQLRLNTTSLAAAKVMLEENLVDEAKEKALRDKICEFTAEKERADADVESARTHVQEADDRINAVKHELVGALEKRIDDIRKSIEETKKTIQKSKQAQNKAQRDLEKMKDKLDENKEAIEKKQEEREKLKEKLTEYEKRLSTTLEDRLGLQTELSEVKKQMEEYEERTQQLDHKEYDAKKARDAAKEILNASKESYKAAVACLDEINDNISRIRFMDLRPFRSLRLGQQIEDEETRIRRDARKLQNIAEGDERMEEDADYQQVAATSTNPTQEMDIDFAAQEGINGIEFLDDGTEFAYQVRQYTDDELLNSLPIDAREENVKKAIQDMYEDLHAYQGRVKMKMQKLKKVDDEVIRIYEKCHRKYLQRCGELDQVNKDLNLLKSIYGRMKKRRLSEFYAGYNQISEKLKEMYQMITIGGDAELGLIDNMDPFSEGIDFSVRPPKKSWKQIQNLSGGEKTLASLALVFALHHYKPTPLYVMDEIDAALDFKNVSILAHYIKERTKNAQFIIISLRNNMFELADRLIGIYKTDDCTKHVVLDLELCEKEIERYRQELALQTTSRNPLTCLDNKATTSQQIASASSSPVVKAKRQRTESADKELL